MPSPSDFRNDRKFEKLPWNWVVVLCKALEIALREKTYWRDQSQISGTLESLRRVKDAGSGNKRTFLTPPDRPWRHVWEIERLKRSLILLETEPKLKADWPLAKELRVSIEAEIEGRNTGKFEHEPIA